MEAPRFNIGVAWPRQVGRERGKVKRKVRNDTIWYRNDRPKYTFTIYTGPRWKIPSSCKVSKSVQSKFDSLALCNSRTFNTSLFNEMLKTKYDKFQLINTFNPPQIVKSFLQSVKDKEHREWMQVRYIYTRLFRLARLLKKLIHIRKVNRCLQNPMNIDDVVSLEIPKKPVYVINFNQGCSYVYEASTILKTIVNRLLNSNYMFPEAKEPVNLLSNEEYSLGQYISVSIQLKRYNMFSWIFDRFKASCFTLTRFNMDLKQQLKIQAINSHFIDQPDSAQDTVLDFFELNAGNYILMTENKINSFIKNYNHISPSPYTQRWINATRRYYIAKELKDEPEILRIIHVCNNLIEECIGWV